MTRVATVLDEFNGSCARRLVTGMDSGGKKGSSMVAPA